MATRQIRNDFTDLMGQPPAGFTARIYVERTDTTSPQAPIYTDSSVVDADSVLVRPNAEGNRHGAIDALRGLPGDDAVHPQGEPARHRFPDAGP